MIEVKAKVTPKKLELGPLRRLNLFAKDLRPAFRELRKPALADQRDHRKTKTGPGGKWPGLASSTRERYRQARRAGKRPPRSLLGRLPAALKISIDRKRMLIESRVPWSKVHNEGGSTGRALLPARKFLWISKQLRAHVRRVMFSTWKKRR